MRVNMGKSIMIIACGSIKNKGGKSLISANLVITRSAQNRKVLFIDADEQEASVYWEELRSIPGINTSWTTIKLHGKALLEEINNLSQNYDDIIIDCGDGETTSLRSALVITDVFLVPFGATDFDIEAIKQACELIQHAKSLNKKLNAYTFINCAVGKSNYNQETKEILFQINNMKLLPVIGGLHEALENTRN
jgi:chromosome partitioning protein